MTTAEFIPARTAGQLANLFMQVVYAYADGRLVVNLSPLDMEFEEINGCDACPTPNIEMYYPTSEFRLGQ